MISGLERIDYRDYPIIAIREILLNCIIHKDYSFDSSTLISIYDDRIKFVSVGGLVKGITLDDMYLGISMKRNKNLSNVFYRLNLIETSNNAFKTTLYDTNVNSKVELLILELIDSNKYVYRKDLEELLSISQTMANNHLNSLINSIIKNGKGKNTVYTKKC